MDFYLIATYIVGIFTIVFAVLAFKQLAKDIEEAGDINEKN